MADDPLSVAVKLGARLEAAGVPWAIGGALALGVHGVVRATSDIDLNVFVEAEELERLFPVLEAFGIQVDRAASQADAARDGVFFCWAGPVRVDGRCDGRRRRTCPGVGRNGEPLCDARLTFRTSRRGASARRAGSSTAAAGAAAA